MPRNKIAKKNLKKTAYFTLGVGTLTVAGGAAVSIPIYYRIQNQLNEKISKIKNLTSYMSQLVTKLGVSPDEEFTRNLKGGYKLVYSNGKTQIYKSSGTEEVLVMNMNKNGAVGSAANFSGPAALGLINVVSEAQDDLEDEASAMQEVLEPFVDLTEEKSEQTESAITGSSVFELRARNAKANLEAEQLKAKLDELKAEANKAGESFDETKINNLVNEQNEQVEKSKKFKGASDEEIKTRIESDAKALRKKIADAQNQLKNVYIKSISLFYGQWKTKINLQQVKSVDPNDYQWIEKIVSFGSEAELETFLKSNEISLKDIKRYNDAVNNIISILVAQTKANETKVQKSLESGSSNNNIFIKITKKPKSLFEALIRSLGYQGSDDGKKFNAAPTITNKLIKYAKVQGFTEKFLDDVVEYFKSPAVGNYKEDADKKGLVNKISISEMLNTFNYVDQEINNMIIFRIGSKIENSDDVAYKNVVLRAQRGSVPSEFITFKDDRNKELSNFLSLYNRWTDDEQRNYVLRQVAKVVSKETTNLYETIKPYVGEYLTLPAYNEANKDKYTNYQKLIRFMVRAGYQFNSQNKIDLSKDILNALNMFGIKTDSINQNFIDEIAKNWNANLNISKSIKLISFLDDKAKELLKKVFNDGANKITNTLDFIVYVFNKNDSNSLTGDAKDNLSLIYNLPGVVDSLNKIAPTNDKINSLTDLTRKENYDYFIGLGNYLTNKTQDDKNEFINNFVKKPQTLLSGLTSLKEIIDELSISENSDAPTQKTFSQLSKLSIFDNVWKMLNLNTDSFTDNANNEYVKSVVSYIEGLSDTNKQQFIDAVTGNDRSTAKGLTLLKEITDKLQISANSDTATQKTFSQLSKLSIFDNVWKMLNLNTDSFADNTNNEYVKSVVSYIESLSDTDKQQFIDDINSNDKSVSSGLTLLKNLINKLSISENSDANAKSMVKELVGLPVFKNALDALGVADNLNNLITQKTLYIIENYSDLKVAFANGALRADQVNNLVNTSSWKQVAANLENERQKFIALEFDMTKFDSLRVYAQAGAAKNVENFDLLYEMRNNSIDASLQEIYKQAILDLPTIKSLGNAFSFSNIAFSIQQKYKFFNFILSAAIQFPSAQKQMVISLLNNPNSTDPITRGLRVAMYWFASELNRYQSGWTQIDTNLINSVRTASENDGMNDTLKLVYPLIIQFVNKSYEQVESLANQIAAINHN